MALIILLVNSHSAPPPISLTNVFVYVIFFIFFKKERVIRSVYFVRYNLIFWVTKTYLELFLGVTLQYLINKNVSYTPSFLLVSE